MRELKAVLDADSKTAYDLEQKIDTIASRIIVLEQIDFHNSLPIPEKDEKEATFGNLKREL
jgi:hypothetical protein